MFFSLNRNIGYIKYVDRQLTNIFPDRMDNLPLLRKVCAKAIDNTYGCISKVKVWNGLNLDLNISGHDVIFLYFLARAVYIDYDNELLATKIFRLNKVLNGIDLFYEIEMPEIFLVGHTQGIVLAKANYGNRIVLHQNCTVGRKNNNRPLIEEKVIMFPGSMIIGDCYIRQNTVIAPGVCLVDRETPGNCYVFSGSNGPEIKEARREIWRDYFID